MTEPAPPRAPIAPLWARVRAMHARALAAIGDAAAIALLTALPRPLRTRMLAWLHPLEHAVRKLLLAEACDIHRARCAAAARVPRGPIVTRIPLTGMARHWRPPPKPAPARQSSSPQRAERAVRAIARGAARAPALQRRPARPTARLSPAAHSPVRTAHAREIDLARPHSWRAPFSFAIPQDPRFVSNARAPRIRNPWAEHAPAPSPPPRAPRMLKPELAPFRLARRFEALRRVIDNPAPYAMALAQLMVRQVRRWRSVVHAYIIAPCRSDRRDPDDPRLGVDCMGAAFVRQDAFLDSS